MEMSRRSFLKSAMLLGAAAAGRPVKYDIVDSHLQLILACKKGPCHIAVTGS